MAAHFTAGDAVRHKSGGPKMIVVGYDEIERVICEWFDGTNRRQETFTPAVLEVYEAPIGIMTIGRS